MEPSRKLTVAIAGATGYVGKALCRRLAPDFRVIGLTRRPGGAADIPQIEWRTCDLFSLIECEQALEDVDVGIYLAHSMIPSARLTQGSFQDRDLILADNFARAAQHRGLRRILYLGGVVPPGPQEQLSRHLASRLEVEQTLGGRGVPLTALRASIVIGAHGSTFSIIRTLLSRLRVIPCAAWSRSLTQPVALLDVLEIFRYCLDHPAETRGVFDVANPEAVSYRQLLERTARLMNLRRRFFNVPFCASFACKLCLSAVTGARWALVSPLVESLRFPMVATDRRLHDIAGVPGRSLDDAIAMALADEQKSRVRVPVAHPAEPAHYDVRSVQRLTLPPGFSARSVVAEYIRWLPWIFRWFLRCEEDADGNVRILTALPGCRCLLLELTYGHDRSPGDDRQVYFITGGALARKVSLPSRRPRLEFREVLNGRAVLLAIHDYRPTLLPWIYEHTQAIAHLLVTQSFARHLRRVAAAQQTPPQ